MNESTAKYLAGLIDSDGTISFDFKNESRNRGWANLGLKVGIASSDTVDRHGFIEGLPKMIGYGYVARHGNEDQYVYWMINSRRDLEMLVPRFLKHMCVKAKHLDRMFVKWKEKRGAILSPDECEGLRIWSKDSRCDSGPLKPKNHPTWAWLAGYLDGNGHYQFVRVNKNAKSGKETRSMRVSVCCHKGDMQILSFLQEAFGGDIRAHPATENAMLWHRNLGVSQKSFALNFLGKVVRFSQFKRHRIEQMIAFHHRQRLSDQTLEGEAIV